MSRTMRRRPALHRVLSLAIVFAFVLAVTPSAYGFSAAAPEESDVLQATATFEKPADEGTPADNGDVIDEGESEEPAEAEEPEAPVETVVADDPPEPEPAEEPAAPAEAATEADDEGADESGQIVANTGNHECDGRLRVYKYHDVNGNGQKDGDEPFLQGWKFKLQWWTGRRWIDASNSVQTTDRNGCADFGKRVKYIKYRVNEWGAPDGYEGWVSTTSLPKVFTWYCNDKNIYVGNHPEYVEKCFVLDYDHNLPGRVQFYVRWSTGQQSGTVDLQGGQGRYRGCVERLPHGTVLTSVEWWVNWNGHHILLKHWQGEEVLYRDKENRFEYDSYLCGYKFQDRDLDGEWDKDGEEGLSGWTIKLYRLMGDRRVLYAETQTDENGKYCFVNVPPGRYVVEEVLKRGWYQTTAPGRVIEVGDGTRVCKLNFGNVPVRSQIEIRKWARPSDCVGVGDEVTWHVEVENTGNTPLWAVEVTDTMFGSHSWRRLEPGEIKRLRKTMTVTEQMGDPIVNIASVTARDLLEREVTDSTPRVRVDVVNPGIEIEKSAPSWAVKGDEVAFTFTVRNTGDVPLYDVVATDDVFGEIGSADFFDVGQERSIVVTITAEESFCNVVAVAAVDECGNRVDHQAGHCLNVIDPAIEIEKFASPECVLVNDEVLYTYTVTNPGDVPLHSITVDDDQLGEIISGQNLVPSESFTVTTTASLSESTVNIATATGWYGGIIVEPRIQVDGKNGIPITGSVSDDDDAAVEVVNPDITVEKTSDAPAEGVPVDTLVTYTYTVTNTGDVTLFNVDLDDDQLGSLASGLTLAPAESVEVTASAILADSVTNVATVTGIDECEHQVSDTAELTVLTFLPFTEPEPEPEEEPFLPFTGGNFGLILLLAVIAAVVGVGLRMSGMTRDRLNV